MKFVLIIFVLYSLASFYGPEKFTGEIGKTNFNWINPETKKPYNINDCVHNERKEYYSSLGYSCLYEDLNFKDGFIFTKTKNIKGVSPHHDRYFRTYASLNEPTWVIAQWGSKYDVFGDGENDGYTLKREHNGLVNTITSKGKIHNGVHKPAKVIKTDSYSGEWHIELNASVEYDKPRVGAEDWPSLLLSQSFENNLINVSKLESLVMEADITVNNCINYMGDSFVFNSHTAQIPWYITLQNRVKGHEDYGKYIWFGVPLFDYRSTGKETKIFREEDAGTSALMYNLNSACIYKDKLEPRIGQRKTAKVEVMNYAREAFDYAKEHGYFTTSEFKDIYIGGTNFGFEVPGTFDISATIHSINVFYK